MSNSEIAEALNQSDKILDETATKLLQVNDLLKEISAMLFRSGDLIARVEKALNLDETENHTTPLEDKIEFLTELQKYHDMYCPDYEPDWNNLSVSKYFVCREYMENTLEITFSRFAYGARKGIENVETIYFPTEEIAQKDADLLNKKYN